MVVYHLPECFRNFGRNVSRKAILVFPTGKFTTGISEWKMCLSFEFSPVPSPTPILIRITCHLVGVVPMVHANPDYFYWRLLLTIYTNRGSTGFRV